MIFGNKDYPDNMTVAELAVELERQNSFFMTGEQFKHLLQGKELDAQGIIDSC